MRDDGESLLPSGRPPHRWFLVGAARSGSALHVDPWATAAWNTVVSGRKRWVLFPPGAARALWPMVAALDEDDTACHWLHHDYGAMCDAVAAEGLEGFDFVQEAGETVYIPSGWLHAVVNLELTIAVTQNFVGPHNAAMAHKFVQQTYPELAREWQEGMRRDDFIRPLLEQTIASSSRQRQQKTQTTQPL